MPNDLNTAANDKGVSMFKLRLLFLTSIFALGFLVLPQSVSAKPTFIHPPAHHIDQLGPQNELRSQIAASFFVDAQGAHRIINLTKQSDTSRNLRFNQFNSGFQVTDTYDVSVGAGPAVSFWFNNPTGWRSDFQGAAGLVPLIGKSMTTVRFAHDLDDASKLSRWTSPPMKASDLNSWTIGDSATFGTQGGIAFDPSIFSGMEVATVSYMISGEFETYVEKVDETHFLVQLSSTKVKTAAASAGISYLALAASKAKGLTRSLSFLVDVKDSNGAKAYEDLVRGNIKTVQKFVREGQLPSVHPTEKTFEPQKANYVSLSFGLPFLFELSWSTGKLHQFTDTQDFADGSKMQTHHGVFVGDSELKDFTHHHSKIGGFYGVSFEKQNPDGTSETGKFGQFDWAFSSDDSNSGELRGAIQTLIRRTGLRELAMVVPDGAVGTNQISFALDLSDAQTSRLMEFAQSASQLDFVNAALGLHSLYFSKGEKGDVDGLCLHQGDATGDCINDIMRESRSGAEEMYHYLKLMAQAHATGASHDFTDAYAKFGRGMIRNQFTFQAALQLAGGASSVVYTIQGTHISKFSSEFATVAHGTGN
jgi:hypothetical protein